MLQKCTEMCLFVWVCKCVGLCVLVCLCMFVSVCVSVSVRESEFLCVFGYVCEYVCMYENGCGTFQLHMPQEWRYVAPLEQLIAVAAKKNKNKK